MNDKYVLLMIIISGAVTFLLRVLPFIAFRKKTPYFITYLGRVLPCAIMAMLVIYCLRDVKILSAPHAVPEFTACAVVIILHAWRRNTLLSIAGGTLCYMFIVQNLI